MKRSNIINIGIAGLFSLQKGWIYSTLYSIICIFCLLLISKEIDQSHRGIYDLIADVSGTYGSTNHNMFIFVAIPIIVMMINQLLDKEERCIVVHKLGSRFRTWNSHVTAAIILALLFTCFILIVSFISSGFLVGLQNTWLFDKGTISQILHNKAHFKAIVDHLATWKIVLTLFSSKFLGCLMIAFLTLFIKQWIKNGAIIVVFLIVLAGLDEISILPFHFFTRMAVLDIRNWLNPMITLYHSLYMFIVCLVLYGVTGMLYERKDFLK